MSFNRLQQLGTVAISTSAKQPISDDADDNGDGESSGHDNTSSNHGGSDDKALQATIPLSKEPQVVTSAAKFVATINKWHVLYNHEGQDTIQEFPGEEAQREFIQLIYEGVDVNLCTTDGVAALLVAVNCWKKQTFHTTETKTRYFMDMIIQLLDHGANLNVQDLDGRTPLLIALEVNKANYWSSIYAFNRNQLVKLLVERGADLDQKSLKAGCCAWPTTPLIEAVRMRDDDLIRFFLSKNADVNARVGDTTALYFATAFRSQEYNTTIPPILDLLIRHGAKIKPDESKILSMAISNCPKAVELLLAQAYGQPQLKEISENDQKLDRISMAFSTLSKCYDGFLGGLSNLVATEARSSNSENLDKPFCLSCLDFKDRAVHRQWFFHSSTKKDLTLSTSAGCDMCRHIRDCLPGEFEQVHLYYYSVPQTWSQSSNSYERILVRGQKPGSWKDDFIFGELNIATIDEKTTKMLLQAPESNDVVNSSDCSFQMIAHWLQTCLTEHCSCYYSRDKLSVLPSRVIDVGPADGSQDPRLLITEGLQGVYVALSYCWGDKSNLSTTLKTLGPFQNSIPFSTIPRTLREAIEVTRKLGIRYLWVDTLCIIQDSFEDWLRESKNIANVYQQCVLTIAAADSEDSEGGLFRKRKRLRTRPVQFVPQISPLKESKQVFVFGDRQRSNDVLRRESRLDHRGWVLQEQLLSPRTLNFSSQELYWVCSTLNASESHPAGIPKEYDSTFERADFIELKMKLAGNALASDQGRVHALWQNMVTLYSRRELTKETDKLIALAGAADLTAKILEDKLLAGLWVKRLWRDLLWHMDPDVSLKGKKCVRSTKFKAPSWSWASMDGPISFRYPEGMSPSFFYPCIQILDSEEKIDIKSESLSGSITLRGLIIPELSFPPEKQKDTVRHELPGFGISGSRVAAERLRRQETKSWQARFWKPDIAGVTHKDAQYLIIAASHLWLVCLGIAPTRTDENKYKRVGVAYWRHPRFNRIPDDLQPRVITIV